MEEVQAKRSRCRRRRLRRSLAASSTGWASASNGPPNRAIPPAAVPGRIIEAVLERANRCPVETFARECNGGCRWKRDVLYGLTAG